MQPLAGTVHVLGGSGSHQGPYIIHKGVVTVYVFSIYEPKLSISVVPFMGPT